MMPDTVHLAYLAAPRYGGWPTYTAHLAAGLAASGHTVQLWQISGSARHEKRTRPYGRGLTYRNTTVDVLADLARLHTVIVTAADAGRTDAAAALLAAGATIVVHDPTELRGDLPAALNHTRHPVVTPRAANLRHLAAWPAVHVPHPYAPAPARSRNRTRSMNAVSYARLDWDKHTELIVEANLLLPPHLRVKMWGAENRLYSFHKLGPIDPHWAAYYRGPFPRRSVWAGVSLASAARWAVDMSVIVGDGGGTQYTHLEALDGGAALALNKGWLTGDPTCDEIADAAEFVDSADQLAALLGGDSPPDRTDVRRRILAAHDAAAAARATLASRNPK